MISEADMARWYEPLLGRLLLPVRQEVMSLCSGRVLDVCCGPGGLSRLLRQQGFGVVGLDLDAVMLSEAHRQEPFAPWVQANAKALPLADKSFDTAVVSFALHAMPLGVAKKVLAEMRRVAARVVVTDYCLVERNMAYPGCGIAHAVEWLVGGTHYRCYRAFMAAGGIEGLLYSQNLCVTERRAGLGGAVTIALCAT